MEKILPEEKQTEKWVKTISGQIRSRQWPRHIDCVFSAWLAPDISSAVSLSDQELARSLVGAGNRKRGEDDGPVPALWKLESDKNKTSKKVALSSASETLRSLMRGQWRPQSWSRVTECQLPSEVNHLASLGSGMPTLMALLISDASYNVRGVTQRRGALIFWAKQSERKTYPGQSQPPTPASLVIMS